MLGERFRDSGTAMIYDCTQEMSTAPLCKRRKKWLGADANFRSKAIRPTARKSYIRPMGWVRDMVMKLARKSSMPSRQ
jgi:hypothetical protein